MSLPRLGIIEGFYGKPWSWQQRLDTLQFLAAHDYQFHIIAPKAITWLRRRWREPIPQDEQHALRQHVTDLKAVGVTVGLGLSPHDFDYSPASPDWQTLKSKLVQFSALGVTELALLFDDIQADDALLAGKQARVVQLTLEHGDFQRLMVCPSYYSDDPILDRVFGTRPTNYLQDLCRNVPEQVDIFWTGEKVCATAISPAHLRDVAQKMGRLPTLWDNYPVNDGQRMSQHLHLRAFSGRPAANAPFIRAHAINPALQPHLTRIPAITLADRYRLGDSRWHASESWQQACERVLGPTLAKSIESDLPILQDVGLDQLGDKTAELISRYQAIAHPGAREIVAWLQGDWRITDEIVRTQ